MKAAGLTKINLALWIFLSFLLLIITSGCSEKKQNGRENGQVEKANKVTSKIISIPPKGQIYHGVFPSGMSKEEDKVTPEDLYAYEQAVGKSAAWIYFSHNWYNGEGFPIETATWIKERGSIPFIRLMMWSSETRDKAEPKYTLDRIINGEFDNSLRAWANEAKDFDFPLLVEYGTEMNGSWFPWNGVWNGGGKSESYGDPDAPDGPEKFQDAYRHIVRIMQEEGANNIVWVFHVNNDDIPDKSWNQAKEYYPGDEWVDWIGVSVYGALTPEDNDRSKFRELMDEMYPRLKALSSSKPIALLEFGVTRGHPKVNQAEWADEALKDLVASRWPGIIGFSWWNEAWENDDTVAHNTEMRVQENQELARIFRKRVAEQDQVLGKTELIGYPKP